MIIDRAKKVELLLKARNAINASQLAGHLGISTEAIRSELEKMIRERKVEDIKPVTFRDRNRGTVSDLVFYRWIGGQSHQSNLSF